MSAYTRNAVAEFLKTPGAAGEVFKQVDTATSTHVMVYLRHPDDLIRALPTYPGVKAVKTLTPLDTIWTFVKKSEDGDVYATLAHSFSLLMLTIRKE